MKNILVPIEMHSTVDSVLQTALVLARKFDSYIEGTPLGPDLPDLVAFDMPVSWTINDQNSWKELAEEAHRKFDTTMSAAGIGGKSPDGSGPSQAWSGDHSLGDSQVASLARVFDITVLGRPGSERGDPRMATAEAALFESGRPIMLAPPKTPARFGDTIDISWNQSTETARATAFAMPLLKKAKKVIVLTVENFVVDGPTGAQCAEMLARHGIAVEAVSHPGGKSSGEDILDQTEKLGGDLLIKGAYTQSRLRQMIFGGATAHILAKAKMPVFMAN